MKLLPTFQFSFRVIFAAIAAIGVLILYLTSVYLSLEAAPDSSLEAFAFIYIFVSLPIGKLWPSYLDQAEILAPLGFSLTFFFWTSMASILGYCIDAWSENQRRE